MYLDTIKMQVMFRVGVLILLRRQYTQYIHSVYVLHNFNCIFPIVPMNARKTFNISSLL